MFPCESSLQYPPSGWRDLAGASEGGKWVPEQGRHPVKILRESRAAYGVELDQIYVVSPFREVVSGCKRVVRDGLRNDYVVPRQLEDFVDKRIGTVHTTQGKEADVVILVLGTDPGRAKKARDWVGNPVNLLNVAVSRARRRLLVIGDYAEWKGAPNFDVFDPGTGVFAHWTVKVPNDAASA